jgi:AcrR family transcriptional regulator
VPSTAGPETPTETERPQRADARRNHERVLAAARECMARDGLDAQMDDIARTAGVGVGTVYRHFPTKDELVRGLAADRFGRLAELATEALGAERPWEGFCGFVRASGRIQAEDRALSEVLTSRPETMREAAEGVGMLALVGRLMERAQASGELRGDARPEDVPMFMCGLAGACSNPLTVPERYVDIMLDGLRAPGNTPLSPAPGA